MEAGDLNRFTYGVLPEINQATIQNIEMQQNPVSNSPFIFSRPTVITAQPQGGIQRPRRPIPVNTSDWISTPRSQLSVLSGSHFLGNVEQLEIQQIVDLSTLLGRSEKRFQYRIKVPKAETLFLAIETKLKNRSNIWNCSKLIHDDFELNLMDQCGETAFIMKMNSSWTYTLNKLHKMSVGSANLIGTVEENFNILGSSFTVYDDTRKELCNIYGPNVCGCCMYQEAQFQIISIDGTHQIASLMHQWDNILHDYILLITFPADMDIKLKSLLLAAAFLLEYMYFEQIKGSSLRT
ncbi:PREDICTED: phospholipid scramblase 1-like isoform X1 [Eufriesea mexicana]|uniref:phospholipid scramblase 1-like isoform X1 n=2 Tax=Eufriesea mexicana TaxID=516756 RepID=UPI00083C3F98|nr:PREDICTED: phospholipid scramblase 1-like isoform X1 [Eufriesea mexicana]